MGTRPEDLFGAAFEERRARQAPLPERLRPRSLDEVVGQDHLLGKGAPLRVLVEARRLPSAILVGPPGTGKTTIARLLAPAVGAAFVQLSAVAAGVKEVRAAAEAARARLATEGRPTLLFVDEVHRFNKAQQDVLLPAVEDGTLVLVGATTENPIFELVPPLRSRTVLFRLEPLGDEALRTLVAKGLAAEAARADDEAVTELVERAGGDGRVALRTLELSVVLARPGPVRAEHVRRALERPVMRHGADEHYDTVSAFIKAVRASDPDAGLYWLARMLEAGEDPRYLARRLVILASEDVGEADPTALLVAEAAARAVEQVGLPEGALNLAQATVHLALAPKSNRVALGLWRAQADVSSLPAYPVPGHLADTHSLQGRNGAYRSPHEDPEAAARAQYLPAELAGRVYYEPSAHGAEAALKERVARVRQARVGEGVAGTGPEAGA